MGGLEKMSSMRLATTGSGNKFEEIEVNSYCHGSYFSFIGVDVPPPPPRGKSSSSELSEEVESS